jgi:hypothetical protein
VRRLLWLALVGCAGGPSISTSDLATTQDLAISLDLSSAPDLATRDLSHGDLARSIAGIACGTTPCAVFAQFCCTGSNGVTGTCVPANATSCGAAEFDCDGPEDCPPADPVCCVENGLAQCKADCFGATVAIMCHDDSTCGTSKCCPAPNGSPYALCLASCP